MPPLAELSVNRPVKTKLASLDGTSTSSDKRQLPTSTLEGNSSSLPSASAIQSMLRSTTEFGDVGQFAVKPANIPRYISTASAHPRAHQHQQARRPYTDDAVGNHLNRKRHYQNQYEQRDLSLHRNRSLRTNGSNSLPSDQPSDSVTQSSINNRRASVHPSLLDIRPHARVGSRPRSPYAYPSRLKRLGHRPSSPAYSELNVSDSVIKGSIQRAYSTRTGSPLSTSSMRRVPQVWNQSINRSDPSLQHYPAVPLSRRRVGNRPPPFLRRAALPRSPLASHRSSFTSKFRAMQASDSGSSGRRVPSPPPLFYDYSEAFEKESFLHTAHRSSLFEARYIPQSDGSSEGYQADVTTTSTTDTKRSDSSTESKAVTPERIAAEAKYPPPLRSVSLVVKQQTPKHNKASAGKSPESLKSSELTIGPSHDASVAKVLLEDDVLHKNGFHSPTRKDNMLDPFTGSTPAHDILQRPAFTYDPAPKVMKTSAVTMRLSSSSSGSQYSSSARSRQEKKSDPSPIKAPETAYERQPKSLSVGFNRVEMIRQENGGVETQQRAASLDTPFRPERGQIFSPVPKRSMSSRDSRDRFSRILSIGEEFGKRDILTSTLPNKKAPMTIQQYLRDRKTPLHQPQHLITKGLPPLPYEAPPVSGKGKEKEISELPEDPYMAAQPTHDIQMPGQDGDQYMVFELEHAAALDGFGRPGIPPRYSSVSRSSLLGMPESSRSGRASMLSQKPVYEEQQRRFALTPRNSSLFQTMKELPPLPRDAVVPILPPQSPSASELPCLFTPLLQEKTAGTAVSDIVTSPTTEGPQPEGEMSGRVETEQQTPPQSLIVGLPSGQASTGSPASARPWNLDISYPWAGTPPRLEISIPQPTTGPALEDEKLPRFRLNMRRASMLGTGGKLSKHRPPKITVLPPPAGATEASPISTRFVELLENNRNQAPNITLVPPSPGLQIEAQSFFSDDSSQREQKNSIRRRLSQIRGAMRATSSDELRAQMSPTFGLSRISKGSSKRSSSAPDVDASNKSTKWKVFDRIKSWFHRKKAKIRDWRRKPGLKNHHSRPFGTHLYRGLPLHSLPSSTMRFHGTQADSPGRPGFRTSQINTSVSSPFTSTPPASRNNDDEMSPGTVIHISPNCSPVTILRMRSTGGSVYSTISTMSDLPPPAYGELLPLIRTISVPSLRFQLPHHPDILPGMEERREITCMDLRDQWWQQRLYLPSPQSEMEIWEELLRGQLPPKVYVDDHAGLVEGRMGLKRPEPLRERGSRSLLRFCLNTDGSCVDMSTPSTSCVPSLESGSGSGSVKTVTSGIERGRSRTSKFTEVIVDGGNESGEERVERDSGRKGMAKGKKQKQKGSLRRKIWKGLKGLVGK
ncbi:MAG: hypothetical protein Q9184_002984 [Pyrenodesmia sp. 2 TL-2023]